MAAKEIAIGKRAKISEAQQYIFLAVLGASLFLGVAVALVMHFVDQISFNTSVIMREEQEIKKYSDTIKNTGICISPKGSIYTNDELKKCDPENVQVSDVPGTLRAEILENLAANEALSSVPRESSSTTCINPQTNKNYTYKELNSLYNNASGSEAKTTATKLIKSCSALRIIPDALPAFKNEEALLASLNNIFLLSGWTPESLSPSGETTEVDFGQNLYTISVNLAVEANSQITMTALNNIERSIREFNIQTATIQWSGSDTLSLHANATAYYMNGRSSIEEENISMTAGTTSGQTESAEEGE